MAAPDSGDTRPRDWTQAIDGGKRRICEGSAHPLERSGGRIEGGRVHVGAVTRSAGLRSLERHRGARDVRTPSTVDHPTHSDPRRECESSHPTPARKSPDAWKRSSRLRHDQVQAILERAGSLARPPRERGTEHSRAARCHQLFDTNGCPKGTLPNANVFALSAPRSAARNGRRDSREAKPRLVRAGPTGGGALRKLFGEGNSCAGRAPNPPSSRQP